MRHAVVFAIVCCACRAHSAAEPVGAVSASPFGSMAEPAGRVGPMRLGVEAGVGFATMGPTPALRSAFAYSRVAPNFSLVADLDLSRYVVLGTGVRFATKGHFRHLLYPDSAAVAAAWDSWDFTLNAKRYYVEVPIIVKLRLPFDIVPRPFIMFGVAAACNVVAKDELTLELRRTTLNWSSGFPRSEEHVSRRTREVDLRDSAAFGESYHTVDVPFEFGGGLDLHFSRIRLRICVRYSIGLVSFTVGSQADKDLRYVVAPDELDAEEMKGYEEYYSALVFETGIAVPLGSRGSSRARKAGAEPSTMFAPEPAGEIVRVPDPDSGETRAVPDGAHDSVEAEVSPDSASRVGPERAAAAPSGRGMEQVFAVVADSMARWQPSYENRLKNEPRMSGRLALEADLTWKGRVSAVRIANTSIRDSAFVREVCSGVRRCRFASISPDTTTQTVRLPLAFCKAGSLVRARLRNLRCGSTRHATTRAALLRWMKGVDDLYVQCVALDSPFQGIVDFRLYLDDNGRVVRGLMEQTNMRDRRFMAKLKEKAGLLRQQSFGSGGGASEIAFRIEFEDLRGPLTVVAGKQSRPYSGWLNNWGWFRFFGP